LKWQDPDKIWNSKGSWLCSG